MARKFKLVSGAGSEGNMYVSVSEDGKVKLLQSLDYEAFTNPSFSIRVECHDERGLAIQKNFKLMLLMRKKFLNPHQHLILRLYSLRLGVLVVLLDYQWH